ncbi:hypothetical protein QIW49_08615, partial [Francisellaceae bacterium CB300]
MADNKNDDSGGWIVVLAIVVCAFLFILKLVTFIGAVIGVVVWLLVYVFFNGYFYTKQRQQVRVFSILGIGLFCYLVLT